MIEQSICPHNKKNGTLSPHNELLNWLKSLELKTQKRIISQILLFLPGYDFKRNHFEKATLKELSVYCTSLNTTFKTYGFCLFCQVVLNLFFESFFEISQSASKNYLRLVKAKASWMKLKRECFTNGKLEKFLIENAE
jgi:hypothetical protein